MRRATTALVCVVVLSASHGVAIAAAPGASGYSPPVDAPVVDGFREPAHRYGPGNRGLEYGVTPGLPVLAAGDGEVVFAGSVAGTLHLTVAHADGLRTSYSFLSSLAVGRGQHVHRGDAVGTTGDSFHFGVREPSGRYLDPTTLFDGSARRRARLVPGTEEGRPPLRAVEHARFLRLVLERTLPTWVVDPADQVLWLHYAAALRVDLRVARVADELVRRRGRRCTQADELPPRVPGRRVLVLVGGLGSSSTSAAVDAVDASALGVAPGDVLRFSYAGGRVPDRDDAPELATVAAHEYAPGDTHGDLRLAAARLGSLLEDVARALPGVPIDVVAHSQGGVVARLALAAADAVDRLPTEVATLATLASPLDGADLATAASAVARSRRPEPLLVSATGYAPSSVAVEQLSEVSELADEVRAASVPSKVGRVSIAARGDLVVATPRTRADDVPSAVVDLSGPDAHGALPGSAATTRELQLLQAGAPPTCRSSTDAAVDLVVGEGVSWATDLVGATALGVSGAG